MNTVFFDISVILLLGTFLATLAKFFRQPMIPAYIIAGVILGPAFLGIIEEGELLETLSTFGIAFLLFLVGIELDLRHFFKAGKIGILVGCVQMGVAVLCGYVLNVFLGFSPTEALFLALALGFSSTIVVTKLLGEKKELDTLYGQIIVGVLLTQDVIAVLLLIFFNVFTGGSHDSNLVGVIAWTLLKGVGLALAAVLASRYLLLGVFRYFARSAELLFLGAICWCLIFALLAIYLGFSIEVGALLAGVSLSILPYSTEIGHRISSLRDFFLPVFFAALGGQLFFEHAAGVIIPTLVLSLFVLIGSSVVVILLMLALGYRTRTSFQAGMTIGQISEFSFVFMNMGHSAGIVDQRMVALVALIGLVTMTLSTYCMEYSERLYTFFRPLLKKLERVQPKDTDNISSDLSGHAVLFGYHTMGFKIRQLLEKRGIPCIIIDHNPNVIEKLSHEGAMYMYGSIGDSEVWEKARIKHAAYVISTVPSRFGNIALLQHMTEHRVAAQSIVVAFQPQDAIECYHHGASYVLFPTALSADHLASVMDSGLAQQKEAHLAELHMLNALQVR